MQITRFGHAAVLVEAADTRILIDPGAFSLDATFELEGLDAIVVTHQHADHIDTTRGPGLLERNPGAVLLCDPESASVLEFGVVERARRRRRDDGRGHHGPRSRRAARRDPACSSPASRTSA